MKMDDIMAVRENTDGIIGKILYYSISNILIDKAKLIEIGQSLGLPKVKPARESKAGAYRNATTALKERIVTKDSTGTHTYRIYCRDNKKEDERQICRELVKETLEAKTNDYKKLANIVFYKETETMDYNNLEYDSDVDVRKYCDKALVLYDRFRNCYNSDHVDSVVQNLLDQMQANKISMHGNLYFVPKPYLPLVGVLKDFISIIGNYNLNDSLVMSNSMFVVDDEEQRAQMTNEFYANYKRDIEFYQERVQHFIDSQCESTAVINRWLLKINVLQEKKKTYEKVLQRQLNDLNSDYAMLQMQAQELQVRNIQGQIALKDVA